MYLRSMLNAKVYVSNNSTKFKIYTINWHETLNPKCFKLNSTYFVFVIAIELNVHPFKFCITLTVNFLRVVAH